MGDILPEPSDTMPQYSPENPEPVKPLNRRTLSILIGLVVIALLALLAGYIYDYSHNHAQDNTRKQDLTYISSVLNNYYQFHQYYPTLNQINSTTFAAFAPTLNRSKFKDPSSSIEVLSAQPSTMTYAYQPSPSSCNNTTVYCKNYKLVAILSDGSNYVVAGPAHKD